MAVFLSFQLFFHLFTLFWYGSLFICSWYPFLFNILSFSSSHFSTSVFSPIKGKPAYFHQHTRYPFSHWPFSCVLYNFLYMCHIYLKFAYFAVFPSIALAIFLFFRIYYHHQYISRFLFNFPLLDLLFYFLSSPSPVSPLPFLLLLSLESLSLVCSSGSKLFEAMFHESFLSPSIVQGLMPLYRVLPPMGTIVIIAYIRWSSNSLTTFLCFSLLSTILVGFT